MPTSNQLSWGIVRYAPGSGRVPEEDVAAFDGWYRDRAIALRIAREWSERYPDWIVGLVQSVEIWFGDKTFRRIEPRRL